MTTPAIREQNDQILSRNIARSVVAKMRAAGMLSDISDASIEPVVAKVLQHVYGLGVAEGMLRAGGER